MPARDDSDYIATRETELQYQIGVPCVVFEAVAELKPLGVGINLQPNAVRELYELGFGPETLDSIGIQTREFALDRERRSGRHQ